MRFSLFIRFAGGVGRDPCLHDAVGQGTAGNKFYQKKNPIVADEILRFCGVGRDRTADTRIFSFEIAGLKWFYLFSNDCWSITCDFNRA